MSIMIANFKPYAIKLEKALNNGTSKTRRLLIMFLPASQSPLSSRLFCPDDAADSPTNTSTVNYKFTLTR